MSVAYNRPERLLQVQALLRVLQKRWNCRFSVPTTWQVPILAFRNGVEAAIKVYVRNRHLGQGEGMYLSVRNFEHLAKQQEKHGAKRILVVYLLKNGWLAWWELTREEFAAMQTFTAGNRRRHALEAELHVELAWEKCKKTRLTEYEQEHIRLSKTV